MISGERSVALGTPARPQKDSGKGGVGVRGRGGWSLSSLLEKESHRGRPGLQLPQTTCSVGHQGCRRPGEGGWPGSGSLLDHKSPSWQPGLLAKLCSSVSGCSTLTLHGRGDKPRYPFKDPRSLSPQGFLSFCPRNWVPSWPPPTLLYSEKVSQTPHARPSPLCKGTPVWSQLLLLLSGCALRVRGFPTSLWHLPAYPAGRFHGVGQGPMPGCPRRGRSPHPQPGSPELNEAPAGTERRTHYPVFLSPWMPGTCAYPIFRGRTEA